MDGVQTAGGGEGRATEDGSPFLIAPQPRAHTRRSESRLLACLDEGPESDLVLDQALAVAKGLDLSVTAARVLETARHLGVPADPIEWQVRRRQGLDGLDRLVAASDRGGSNIERVLLAGPAADELTVWAKEHDATLMALGTHDRPADLPGLGGTAQRVMARATASLLLVPAGRAARPPYRHILVPLDGSQRAESVLPVAARLARAHGAELVLVHVVPRIQAIGDGPLEAPTRDLCLRLAEQNEQGARDYLDALEAQLWKERLPVRAIVARDGDPRSELLRLAREQQADLIIVASHGSSGMADVPCGSVTEYLATHAPTALLIVRPDFAHVFAAPAAPASHGSRSASPQPA